MGACLTHPRTCEPDQRLASALSDRRYPLPRRLACHVSEGPFAPDALRSACREAGEGLGREDAGEARYRSAAEMVAMWEGLDLPAHVAPYALRDARLGYLGGHTSKLVSGELPLRRAQEAAEARWQERWHEKLAAARDRSRNR